MAHYAKVKDGKVIKVIVAEASFFDTFVDTSAGKWIKTSYNTKGGIHKLGDTPLRKNFAGIGYTYDEDRDAFIPPKTYTSWILNEDTCLWEAPVAKPTATLESNQYYSWNESIVNWEIKTRQ